MQKSSYAETYDHLFLSEHFYRQIEFEIHLFQVRMSLQNWFIVSKPQQNIFCVSSIVRKYTGLLNFASSGVKKAFFERAS